MQRCIAHNRVRQGARESSAKVTIDLSDELEFLFRPFLSLIGCMTLFLIELSGCKSVSSNFRFAWYSVGNMREKMRQCFLRISSRSMSVVETKIGLYHRSVAIVMIAEGVTLF